MLFGWWVASVSMGLGLLLALFALAIELVMALRYRHRLEGPAEIRAEFVGVSMQKQETPRAPASVSGRNKQG